MLDVQVLIGDVGVNIRTIVCFVLLVTCAYLQSLRYLVSMYTCKVPLGSVLSTDRTGESEFDRKPYRPDFGDRTRNGSFKLLTTRAALQRFITKDIKEIRQTWQL